LGVQGKKIYKAPDGSKLDLLPSQLANNTKTAKPGQRAFQIVVEALSRIHLLARQNSATAVIILQPSKEEVYLPLAV
jgi:hypothetical protein